jgi:hypothetical protein
MSSEQLALRDVAFMESFLDAVIPPSEDGRMPGAGSLGLADEVASALEGDATLGPVVEAGLRAAREAASGIDGGFAAMSQAEQVALIESQVALHPGLMGGVIRYLYLAYYQHPTVLVGLGEPARPRFPGGFKIDPTDPALMDLLISRAKS